MRSTFVYYTCGMIFDLSEIYETPSLDKLRFVDIVTAPPGWTTNQSHAITFQEPDDQNPFWCSDPTEGRALSIHQLSESNTIPKKLDYNGIKSLIWESIAAIQGIEAPHKEPSSISTKKLDVQYLPDCFTLVSYGVEK